MSQAGGKDKVGIKRAGIAYLLIYIFLAVVIILAGSIFYRSSRRHFQSEAEKQLTIIAELKKADLVNWRQERLADGAIFFKNENFSARVHRAFASPEDRDAQEKLSTWPRQFQEIFKYERIILLDANGVERLTFPATPKPLCATLLRQAPEIMRSGQVVFLDLHRDAPAHPIHLAVAVPILDEINFRLPLGLLVLKIDPAAFLYPFIQRWPLPSRTAETLLVRRDGNDVLFLNELKFQKNTALNLRIPLSHTNVPAVRAALGQEGIVEGEDYRGIPVISVIRSIPGSPWSMIARIDKAEVFAPLAERLRLIIILVAVLLLGSGTGLALLWRRRQVYFFKEQAETTAALHESQERFRVLFESSIDAMMTLEPPDWNFSSGNPATLALFRAKNVQEFIHFGPGNLSPERQPDGRASGEKAKEMIETAMRQGSHFFEWTHMRTDGEEFPATVLLTRMEQAGKVFLQATVTDITNRKLAEKLAGTLYKISQAIYATKNLQELFEYVHRALSVIISTDNLFIALLSADGKTLTFPYDIDEKDTKDSVPIEVDNAQSLTVEVFKTKKSLLLDETKLQDRYTTGRNKVWGTAPKCWLGVPLIIRETAIGVMAVQDYHKPGAYSRKDVELLESAAGQIALAIERKRMEDNLARFSRQNELILSSAGEGIMGLDLQGKHTFINQAAARMLGYEAGEFLGLPSHSTWHHSKADGSPYPGEECPIYSAFRDGMEHRVSTEVFWRKDGTSFPVEYLSTPIHEQGRLAGAVVIFSDISERKRAESQREAALKALGESEERFRGLSASAQDAILMMDDKGRLTFWNGAAERIFGYSESEALGANLHDLIAPQRYHPAHNAAFPEFVRTGQGAAVGQTLELQALQKDGSEITVALSLSAVQIKGSWHAVGILRDISKQKIAEKELYNLLDELEQANNKLETANKRANELAVEAQAANIAKSQFLANMSHEIRTPMNGVIGMIELLLGTDLSAEQRRYAQTVGLSGEALLGVINDILDFSKIEADKLELETIDFDLRTTVEDAAELLAVRAQEKNLEFICRVDPDVQTFLKGDPGRLRQILINLGSNAIKFTARGEVFIEVKLESESMEQLKIRVTVRDTGIGIPADKIGLLFSAFQQVDASTTRRFGGTGLGLAICKRLTEAMGGAIGIESVEGRGSTFWFTAVFGKQPKQDRSSGTGQAKISGVRVLVVDDNATNRLILSEQLASWDARHAEAESAAQALDLLRTARSQGDPFRIVISDLQMPEMDGESLGKAIKADPEISATVLVMMTSLGRRGDAKRLKAIGFSAYLTKPVKQSQLYDCLATVLGAAVPEAGAPDATLVTRHSISESRRLNVRILLVEDNLTNQQVALGILEKLGFRGDVANNGRDAIKALETIAYDLVLMDVQMPVMDGFEATAAIRSGKTAVPDPKIPIIAMTAHAMKGDRERCLEAGMDDYIAKPIAPKALAAALDTWLDQTLNRHAAIPAAPAGPMVFDRQAFMERLMNDLDLVKEITVGFLLDMPEQIHMLKRHIGRGNVKAAGLQAHAIKGAAANVGGLALSAAAMALEKAAQAKRLDEVTALCSELERQFQLLQERLLENDK